MKILGIIPARYASTRLPGKPLVQIAGKTMIQHVYEQAKKSLLDTVLVATDDDRIINEVNKFGGLSMLTSEHHKSGTDRCAEVSKAYPDYDLIINIQGDEPFIDPKQIDLLISVIQKPETQIATLIKKIETEKDLFDVNTPKVITNKNNEAIYFSRQTIPFLRNFEKEGWLQNHTFFKHIGIYAYKKEVLAAISLLQTGFLENAEHLEQLRWLENGYQIQTAITTIETLSVDTEEDLKAAILHQKNLSDA